MEIRGSQIDSYLNKHTILHEVTLEKSLNGIGSNTYDKHLALSY